MGSFLVALLSQTCSALGAPISITRTYATDSLNENVELWEGEEGTGNLLFFQSGRNYDSQTVYDFLCASRSLLTLVLTSFIWMFSLI